MSSDGRTQGLDAAGFPPHQCYSRPLDISDINFCRIPRLQLWIGLSWVAFQGGVGGHWYRGASGADVHDFG